MLSRWLGPALVAVTVAACTEPSAPVGDTCDANPEAPAAATGSGSGIGPRGVATNRIALNRIALNRIALNRIALNRIALNRIALNRIALNRIALNRIALNGIELDGARVRGIVNASNELVGTTTDGQLVRGETFVGATVAGVLSDGSEIDLQITKFERTDDPAIVHYSLAYGGENLCEAGTGMFVPGTWDDTGAYRAADESGLTTSYSCVDGMIGKCAAWGYAAWKAGSDMHAACTRMGTADYCGSGVSFTKDGTAIDMFDARGIQKREGDGAFAFEAGWGPNGATCVSRPRYDAVTGSGKAALPSCWTSLGVCESWPAAQTKGALVGNASRPQTRTFCE
jgi:hypothetical protein